MSLHGISLLSWLSDVPLNTALLVALVGMVAFVVLIEVAWMMYLASRTWAMYCAGRKAQAEKQTRDAATQTPEPTGAITARDVLGEEEWAKICRARVQSMDAMMRTMREQCSKETDEKKHDLDS